jgi:hypothetical protein
LVFVLSYLYVRVSALKANLELEINERKLFYLENHDIWAVIIYKMN